MNVKVIGSKVLAEEVTETQVEVGGIIIPDSANESPRECVVKSVGCGVVDELIEVGCTLLISKGAGVDVNIDTKEFIIVDECDIIAVIN